MNDLILALPELGIDKDAGWSRNNVELMLNMLNSQNHGSSGQAVVTFNEFSSFILKPKVVDRDSTRDNIVNEQQRQVERTISTRNTTTSGLHSNPHQSERQASAVENVKKSLGLHNSSNKRRNVSSLSKVREALDSMDPLFTDRLNPSKAQAALSNSLHVEDTLLLQKDWKAFVNTLDHDETGHISINELLRLLFSSSDPNEKGQLKRNKKIGDKTDASTMKFHRSAYASAAPSSSIPRVLRGKQLNNSIRRRDMTKKIIANRCSVKGVRCCTCVENSCFPFSIKLADVPNCCCYLVSEML